MRGKKPHRELKEKLKKDLVSDYEEVQQKDHHRDD